jgi:hypothetical protein
MAYENRGRFEQERHDQNQNKGERERGRSRGRSQAPFERGQREEAGNEPRFARPYGDEDFGSEEEYWREPNNLPDWTSRESGNREWGRERSATFSDPRRTHGQTGVCESCGSLLYGTGQEHGERWHGGERGRFTRRGPYSGKGPKGYRRSDERIAEDANQALMDHPDIDASEIEVSAKNGEVTLRGSVSDRWAKRQAEECIEQVPGVQDVRNELRTQQPAFGSSTGQGGTEQGSRGSSSSSRTRGEER